VLTVVLTLASTLFSVTATSFLGFYNSFNAYLGEGEDVVAVYDVQSRTPFSGVVPAYLTDRLGGLDGVLVCSPEVILPCVIQNQSVFVRGVLPLQFSKLNSVELVDGVFLDSSDFDSVVVGKGAADRLDLKVGDTVLVLGTLADRYIELKVTGVFLTHSSLDDEVLVSLNVAQWLRFSNYDLVTLIRVKIDPDTTSQTAIYQALAKNASQTPSTSITSSPQTAYQVIVPWSSINFAAANLGVANAGNVMKGFLDRFGITKEALTVLSVMVFFFSSVTIAVACQTLLQQQKSDLNTLRCLGVSRRRLKLDVACRMLPLSVLASVFGCVLAWLVLVGLEGSGFLRVLSHGVVFSIDPLVMALNVVLVSLLSVLSVIFAGLD
jgi:ABC-type lipoprotein release transport system permease subunit